MSLNKKHSRLITVEGNEYRWACAFGSGITNVTIQSVEGSGRKCIVQVGMPDQLGKSSYPSVTPSSVADFVLQAQKLGWTPTTAGGEVGFNALPNGDLVPV